MSFKPQIKKCRCGNTFEPRIWHKIIMLIRGEYVWTCNQCGSRYEFILVNHVVKNKSYYNDLKGLWKNG